MHHAAVAALQEAAAFRVFGLERPTAERPYIAGLLDPCTNSKLAPNIPAESLYDKQVGVWGRWGMAACLTGAVEVQVGKGRGRARGWADLEGTQHVRHLRVADVAPPRSQA